MEVWVAVLSAVCYCKSHSEMVRCMVRCKLAVVVRCKLAPSGTEPVAAADTGSMDAGMTDAGMTDDSVVAEVVAEVVAAAAVWVAVNRYVPVYIGVYVNPFAAENDRTAATAQSIAAGSIDIVAVVA